MRTKMKYLAVVVAGVLGMSGSLWAASVQDAAEDAAYQAVRRMTLDKPAIKKIAFVGLFNDKNNLTPAFRGGLNAAPGVFDFYTRDENEFNLLVSEIEFGERREDVMVPATIQKFGKISGVDALLYGDILSVDKGTDSVSVKISWYLSDVETGQQVAFGTVEGVSKNAPAPAELYQTAVKAVASLAEKVKEMVKSDGALKNCDVVVMPLQGWQAGAVSRILGSKLSSNAGGVRFFDMPGGPVKRRMFQRLAMEVGKGVTPENKERVVKQLAQVVNDGDSRILAVLTGTVEGLTANDIEAEVTVSLSITDIAGGEKLWSDSVSGSYKMSLKEQLEDQVVDPTVKKITPKTVGLIIVGILGAVVILVLLSKMFRVK